MRSAAVLLGILLAAPALAAPPDPAAYKAEIDAFRQQREASLRSETGWLTLVGLSWLEEGDNSVGSAPKSRVLLPKGKAPEKLGSIRLEKGTATFTAAPGADIAEGGKPAAKVVLKPDAPGPATVLTHGSLSFFAIKRGSRFAVRVRDRDAASLKGFNGVPSYPADPAWRFVARFEKYQPAKKVEVPNVLGAPEMQDSPGAVVFTKDGKSWRLEALVGGARGELFLVFGDQTNAKETYGGGRFLHTPPPAADGTVVVDFNKAVNPPCAFTPYATCPLPPASNKLALSVTAGEKSYGKH
ncbi:MAG TPA: DUF1684 domain-containing protein [Thermoanaerobaculia bacterium]|nr:DUF1684 domain-containing protein [Thermoanaerobaculia bacterium]HQR66444.1 DUF1684 domain-containing protein [Thermoanaerobaculia bacterium]